MLNAARFQDQLEELAELVMNLSSSRVQEEFKIVKARKTMDSLV